MTIDKDKLIEWLLGDDTGVSSKEIARQMAGIEPSSDKWGPCDPSDLGRCLRLLALFPGWDVWEMRTVSDAWWRLVNHWGELSELYHEELPTGNAPRTYARMQEIKKV